jgi:hypothetical protein
LLVEALPITIEELDHPSSKDGHLAVFEGDNVTRVSQNRWNVGGNEEFAVANPDDDWRTFADSDNLARIVGADEDETKDTANRSQRPPNRALEAVAVPFLFDEVRDNFRVGVGRKAMARRLEPLLELEVVLDDTVVNDDNPPRTIAMRVRVVGGGSTVGGPPGMTNPVIALEWMRVHRFDEARQFAGASAYFNVAVTNQSDARRVVSAILETSKTVEEHGNDWLGTEISDDSAHSVLGEGALTRRLRRPGVRSFANRPGSAAKQTPSHAG